MDFPQDRVKTSAVDTEVVAAGVTQSAIHMEIAVLTSMSTARGKTTVPNHQARVLRPSLTPPIWLLLQLQLAATALTYLPPVATAPPTFRVSRN